MEEVCDQVDLSIFDREITHALTRQALLKAPRGRRFVDISLDHMAREIGSHHKRMATEDVKIESKRGRPAKDDAPAKRKIYDAWNAFVPSCRCLHCCDISLKSRYSPGVL